MSYKGCVLWSRNKDYLGRTVVLIIIVPIITAWNDKGDICDCGIRVQEVFQSANKTASDVDNGNEIGLCTSVEKSSCIKVGSFYCGKSQWLLIVVTD